MIFLKETRCYGPNYVQNVICCVTCYWPITDSVTISLRIFMAMFFPGCQVQMQRLKSQITDVNYEPSEARS